MVLSQSFASDISLFDVVQAVRMRFRFFLAFSAAIFVFLSALIFSQAPVYRAYVTLAPSEPLVDPNPMSVAQGILGRFDFANVNVFEQQTSANSALALLRSKAISRQFIETEGLLPILFADQWDSEREAWREAKVHLQPTINDGLQIFEREVRFISQNPATGFIRVNIEWSDPELVSRWANRLVEMTDSQIRERDIVEARQSIGFLEERVQNVRFESVRQLMYKLIESNAKKIMVARIKDSYVFTVIDPAVTPRRDDTINMPVSFKLSLALMFALGCSMLWVVIAVQFGDRSA
jgi:uncharacterized protein involved in exopolysaccharide biosynthesis